MPESLGKYSTSLDRENAYWMARMCQEIYLTRSDTDQHPDEPRILANLRQEDPGFISVVGADKNSAQGGLIEHESYYCMVFRGTNQKEDWLDNLKAFPVKQLFGEFHRGFWQSVQDVWDVLYNAYSQANAQRPKPLFITGHSLGGAMAAIAAARFIQNDEPFVSVYTFGQPRAMTRDTASIFNVECKSRFYRFNNNNDLVTRVPARVMGYSHVGTYLHIASDGVIHQEIGFWYKFLDSCQDALKDFGELGLDGVKDHSMESYIAAVQRWQFAD